MERDTSDAAGALVDYPVLGVPGDVPRVDLSHAPGLLDAVEGLGSAPGATTHPSVFVVPSTPAEVMSVVTAWAAARRTRWLEQGASVRTVAGRLLSADPGIRGTLVPDAVLAATAIAHGAQLATADRGFARFPGLRVVHPLG